MSVAPSCVKGTQLNTTDYSSMFDTGRQEAALALQESDTTKDFIIVSTHKRHTNSGITTF